MLQGLKRVRVKNGGYELTVQVWLYKGVIRYYLNNNWYNPAVFEKI